jgi:hypothetical protein
VFTKASADDNIKTQLETQAMCIKLSEFRVRWLGNTKTVSVHEIRVLVLRNFEITSELKRAIV